MKTFLIVLLTLALLAAAVFTRPSEEGFRDHLARSRTSADATDFRKAIAELEADAYAERCTFHDRLLWVDVERDGKTIYTGAFAHWFRHGKDEPKRAAPKSERARKSEQATAR